MTYDKLCWGRPKKRQVRAEFGQLNIHLPGELSDLRRVSYWCNSIDFSEATPDLQLREPEQNQASGRSFSSPPCVSFTCTDSSTDSVGQIPRGCLGGV